MNIHTTAVNRTSRSPLRQGFSLIGLALLALSPVAWAQSNDTEVAQQCGPGTLRGTYMSEQRGELNGLATTQVNRIVSDGMGGITGNGTVVVNGVPTVIPLITATYTIDSDCNGTLTSVPAGLSQTFVIKKNGCQVFFIVTAHPAGVATISGEAVKVSNKTD